MNCAICRKPGVPLSPLHGESGGPLVCWVCSGKWHAEHGRRRKAGRVVIQALRAYMQAGGKWQDITKLGLSAVGESFGSDLDPLGYLANAAKGEFAELTSELLEDAVRITHPDGHPPERKELASRVTQQLLALKPYVFPAQKPLAPVRNGSVTGFTKPRERSVSAYPCEECASTVPYYYCAACKAEYDKCHREELDRENKKQRERYAKHKQEQERLKPQPSAHHAAWRSKANEKTQDFVLTLVGRRRTAIGTNHEHRA